MRIPLAQTGFVVFARYRRGQYVSYLCWVLLVFVSAGIISGQTDTGTIAGTLKDSSGALITGAKVHIQSATKGVETMVKSNGSGEYVSPPLRADSYVVRVEAPGFSSAVSKLTLELNHRAVLDFTLQVGSSSQTVDVQATAPLLESESATVGSLQNEQAVKNLPLNTRNFNQLIGLATGVVPGGTQQTGGSPITAARGITANTTNGIGFRSNNYRVDGVDNSENHNGQGILLYPPVEAIQEFRVQTSVPTAEFGRGGATINVAYKSGGRNFHGDAFEFLRNSALDAKNFFDRPGSSSPFRMNQYGATLGGPIVLPHYNRDRSKTFFFFSCEGERRSQSLTYVSTVPTIAFKNGDFSASPQKIFDPLTNVTLSDGRVQRSAFPGNIIPANRFNSTGLNLLRLFPDPNASRLVSNYVSNPAATVNRDNFDIKIDQNFTSRDQVFFRYSHHSSDLYTPGSLPPPAVGTTNASRVQYPLNQAVVSYTRTLTPNLINEAKGAATRLNTLAFNENYGNNVADQVGIPGVNAGDDKLLSGLTQINLNGYASLGDSGFFPAIIANNNFQFNDAVTWVHGGHTFKFGGEIIRRQENLFQSPALHGVESFGPIYTTNPVDAAGTGNSLADLLLGAAASGNIGYLNGAIGKRRTDYALFATDTWKVTNALTLTLGLRYDAFPQYPWAEVYNRMSSFRPDLGSVFPVTTPQIPWRSGVRPRYNDLGPRVGLAYRLGQNTVIRAGVGIFYSPDIGGDLNYENPPFVGSVAFTNNQFNFPGATLVSDGFTRPPGLTFPTLGAAFVVADPNLKTPTASQWNFSIERNLPSQILFTAAYVGTSGKHLLLEPNLNQAVPGPGAVGPRRPFPQYSDISWVASDGSSNYNSLQISAEKRMSAGVEFLASYTYAHAIDFGGFEAAPQNALFLPAERGNADTDIRHRFVLSAVWELPVGRGRKFGSSMPRLLDSIAGGWQINTISNVYTGLPFTPTSSVNTLNGSGTQRPDRVGSGVLPSDQRSVQRWFDTTAFRTPAPFQFGNSGRNILYGPGTVQFDVAFAKSFYFSSDQTRRLEFRSEMFNIANTPQFNNPNASIGSLSAGIISSAGSPVTFQRTSRQIQMALKLYF